MRSRILISKQLHKLKSNLPTGVVHQYETIYLLMGDTLLSSHRISNKITVRFPCLVVVNIHYYYFTDLVRHTINRQTDRINDRDNYNLVCGMAVR